MRKSVFKATVLIISIGAMSVSSANWFGKNNGGGWGNFNNNRFNGYDDNDWPEWTPMYWMEEMFDNDNDRYRGRYRPAYPPSPYANAYPNPYANPYGSRSYANPYAANPYLASQYPRLSSLYRRNPYSAFGSYPNARNPYMSGFNPYRFGSGFNQSPAIPFVGGSNYTNPLSSFSSPFSSPLSGISPMSSFGGFGSPLSPMSPVSPMSMGTMGMPGMSPMSSMGGFGSPFGGSPFGGSPFGGSGFSPFR